MILLLPYQVLKDSLTNSILIKFFILFSMMHFLNYDTDHYNILNLITLFIRLQCIHNIRLPSEVWLSWVIRLPFSMKALGTNI